MYKATFEVRGMTDLMFGKATSSPRRDDETYEAHERRVWPEKVPVTADGQCYVNPFAVTNSLVEAAKWLKRKVPGERGAMFGKRFQCGVSPGDKVLLFRADGKPATLDDIEPLMLFVPSDGKHGGPKRVERIFPTLHEWSAKGSLLVFDGKISQEQLHDHLVCVGQYVGWGAMRVANGGINGRFQVVDISATELAEA